MDFFSKDEADVIGEISNISIGSSATSMNKMLGQPIKITTPDVSLVHKDEILVFLSEYNILRVSLVTICLFSRTRMLKLSLIL